VRLVDSHCHLDDEQFDADRDAVIERAHTAGVERMVVIGTGDGPPDLEPATRLAERHSSLYATVGVHPHHAAKVVPGIFARLRQLLEHPKVVALGEIGLDYHYDFSPRDVQREVFRRQLHIAASAEKPVVIHTREAWDDTMAILAEELGGPCVLHCFTGGPAEAEQALGRGYYLSYGGVVTFPKAENVRESARLTPEDRLLVETDAPYLAPAPYRGKRNEPAFLTETVRKLAEVRGATPEQIAESSARNFERLCLREKLQSE